MNSAHLRPFRFGVTITAIAALAACASAPLNPGGFLDRLRSRDTLVDNASLQFIVQRTIKVDFQDWNHPLTGAGAPRPTGPRQLTTRTLNRLTMRGSDVTLSSETIWPPFPKKIEADTITPALFSKFSNTSGMIREISETYPRRAGLFNNISCEIRPLDPARDILPERRMAIEFALGIGMAKRIHDIAIFERRRDGMIRIEGTLDRIWSKDKSVAQITMDPRGIVRRAVIEAWVGDALNMFDVTTSGTQRAGSLWLAKNGHYRRTLQMTEGVRRIGRASVVDEFDIEFKSAEFDLSPARYGELTDMDVPDGALISDRIRHKHYKKGEIKSGSPR